MFQATFTWHCLTYNKSSVGDGQMDRLQGKDFVDIKSRLRKKHITKFFVKSSGNIRVDFNLNGYRFCHYLNDTEKQAFRNSDYFKSTISELK